MLDAVVVVAAAALFLTLIHCGYQDNDVELFGHEDISASPQSAPLERRPVSSEIDFFKFIYFNLSLSSGLIVVSPV